MKKCIAFLLCFVLGLSVYGQDQLLQLAKQYLLSGNYEKAAATYKQLAEYNPEDDNIQQGYIESLIGIKDYATAEKVIKTQLKHKDVDEGLYTYSLAKVYKAQGEDKKARKLFDKIIDQVSPFDADIRKTAIKFEKDGLFELAIATYEKGKSLNKENPYLYAEELAVLFDKKGDSEKAVDNLMNLYVSQPEKGNEVKSTLQRLMNKPEKMERLMAKIQQRADKEPEMYAWPDLLAWIYIQQKNYIKAFQQIQTIDNRLNEMGRRILGFARVAFREKEFKTAIMAYDAVVEKGKDQPFYLLARSERLSCLKEQLANNPTFTQAEVKLITAQYETFLLEYPLYKTKETNREYAELEARYAHDINKAILILTEITSANNAEKQFRGRCKLEMGDYELIRENVWESTLLYSQVDKEFKQDVLGEEARFRNAKLSYYGGDFEWAQGQLDVLKASTSELIANDALNLSVLITENNPIKDSNQTPLLMFAHADLLEFQNKNEEAIAMLDSISALYPAHPLMDDILMVRAEIAYKRQDFNESAMHLQKIVTNYADDVLADDAMFQLAKINEVFFKNNEEAKRLYEQVIIKYPGSTFVNEARKSFRRLRGDKADVEEIIPLN
ncbi:MAG: tetratricopeptide repeat protein [Chitinophagaceae bacterium]|nr:tetratricopeptide repeat protein [Chitinophagaceae bacterium]